jgi:hypothetical protein
MTEPIRFNPFKNIGETQQLGEIQDRRKSLRFPEINLEESNFQLNTEIDEEGLAEIGEIDLNFDNKIPKR